MATKAPAKTARKHKAGPGRPKGSKNKRTLYKEMQAAKAAAKESVTSPPLVEAGKKSITAVEYLQSVLNDPQMPQAYKMEAARALAPYQSPKLNSVTIKGDLNTQNTNTNLNGNMSRAQLRKVTRELLKEI